MIYEIAIGIIVLCAIIYYLFCFLELMGILKFTTEDTTMQFGKALIPFYYLFKK